MSNCLKQVKNINVKKIVILVIALLSIPYIEIIIKSIYTLGTIVGTLTRYYNY